MSFLYQIQICYSLSHSTHYKYHLYIYIYKRFLQVFFIFLSLLIYFQGERYSSNFYCSLLYLPNIQLNFINFKLIIQISHLLRNNKIITIIKSSSQNYNVILTKIKMKPKEYKPNFIIFYYSNNWQEYSNLQPCKLCFDIISNYYFQKNSKY